MTHWSTIVAAAVGLAALSSSVHAQETHHRRHVASAAADRPLTIQPRHHGVYRQGNDIIAPGGFSANGYGYPAATAEELREARNAQLRANSTNIYGYGFDGVGGTGFGDDDLESGFSNPFYGNTFSSYTGYNGTPTALAFGPGFANRYAADHDPDEDDDETAPGPGEIGYRAE